MPTGFTNAHLLTLHGLVMAMTILYYVISTHLTHQRRQPAAAIAWMLFIVLVPYLALPSYMMFGARKVQRPRAVAAPQARQAQHGRDDWAAQTIAALGQPPAVACLDLTIHADGSQALQTLLATIDGATQTIDVSTFILGRDALGELVIEHLSAKARQGVRVRFLLDGMGSLMARRFKPAALIKAGGAFTLFVPPLRSPLKGRTNLRDHRKLVVVDAGLDSGKLWCGGRNLANEYFIDAKGVHPWHDLSFDVRGPLVQQAQALFEHDWAFAHGHPLTWPAPDHAGTPCPSGGAQLVASGPDQADDTIHALLVTAAYRARQRMVLVTPYFVPDGALLMALCLAARRGVTVDLLIPARSNHKLSDLARARALRTLSEAGGRIWLTPAMLHAKLVLVDDELALSGSANLDSRSLFINYELMVAFHDAEHVRRFAAWAEHERSTARPYVASRAGLSRDVAEGMLLWLGFQL